MCALRARPRPRPLKCCVHIAQRRQPVKRRIHPAIERNIGGTRVLHRLRSFFATSCADRIPCGPANLRIMVRPVNILGHQPSHSAADQHVRRKVLLASHAGYADGRGKSVDKQLRHRSRIFVHQDSSGRPRSGRVSRRKRISALEKVALPVPLVGPLAARGNFHALRQDETVDHRFPGQQAGLALMRVARVQAPEIHPTRSSAESGNAPRSHVVLQTQHFGAVRQASAQTRVRQDHPRRDSRDRNQPLGV